MIIGVECMTQAHAHIRTHRHTSSADTEIVVDEMKI